MSGDGKRIADAVIPHTERGDVPGLAWAVAIGDELYQGAAGCLRVDGDAPVRLDTIFRISSMTKPITAVAALQLVDDGTLALDDPVDEVLPELADRRVLAPGATSLDDTLPATRPITLRDVLTFRLGWGMDFTDWGPTNHLTPEQLATCAPDPSGAQGWGFGVGVQVRATPTSPLGSYGWAGGLGSSWANDPATGVVGVLMTNQMWTSPVPPPVVTDFWTAIVGR